MNINKIFITLFIAMLSMSAKASLTYSIFDDLGGATISGTITTDGTIGTLSNSNITKWDIFLDDGTYSRSLNSKNSYLYGGNSKTSFVATLDDLTFDHSLNNFFLFFANDGMSYWCFDGLSKICSGGALSSSIAINNSGSRIFYARADTGLQSFKVMTSVPGPSSLLLLGLCLAGIGFTRKRK